MQLLQWAHSKLVPPATIQSLDGPTPFTWCSEVFPYTVPAGHWLGITRATIGSKFTDGGAYQRASLFCVSNLFTVADNVGVASFSPPFVVPEGATFRADLINNDAEQQWMTSSLHGILIEKTCSDWREAFAFLFPGTAA